MQVKQTLIIILVSCLCLAAFAGNGAEPEGMGITVHVTCYQPVASQCMGDPLVTSDGSRIDLNKLERGEIRWCAVSPDIHALLKGRKQKRIWVEGFGVMEIHDTTNKRFTKRVDILLHPSDKTRYSLKEVKAVLLE